MFLNDLTIAYSFFTTGSEWDGCSYDNFREIEDYSIETIAKGVALPALRFPLRFGVAGFDSYCYKLLFEFI